MTAHFNPDGIPSELKHYPELPAYDTGRSLVVWCAHCHRWHSHGRGNSGNDGDGHRVAHCIKPNSPYDRTGYVLLYAGPAPSAVLQDIKRRRPHGLEVRP